jgi:hypothetical protein
MAFRPILAPLAVLMWAATAIIHGAHATEHPAITAELHHHHHNKSCQGKAHKACKGSKHAKHAIGHHGRWIITDEAELPDGPMSNVADAAEQYQGLDERHDAKQLRQLFGDQLDMDINPRRTAWCAAFANAVLVKAGYDYSGSLESASFVRYGKPVKEPARGDIVVLHGGRRSPTHVGFLVGTARVNGQLFYTVLGGNQSNRVQISYFPASKVIAIRRVG